MGRQVMDIMVIHHNYTLKIRAQDAVLQSPLFPVLWDEATKEEQKKVLGFIKKTDIKGLKRWMKKHEPTVRELRVLASNERIKNYSRLSKVQLIEALEIK